MFLLVPAYPGCPGSKAVKRSLLLLLLLLSSHFYEMKVFLIFSELTVINVTHTHLFNGPFSGTTQVSRYQKDKTNQDYAEARDTEWQWHQLGRMQVCTSLQQITTSAPHHSVFYRPDALPAAQPTASKH